jgi:hypothetical protein
MRTFFGEPMTVKGKLKGLEFRQLLMKNVRSEGVFIPRLAA